MKENIQYLIGAVLCGIPVGLDTNNIYMVILYGIIAGTGCFMAYCAGITHEKSKSNVKDDDYASESHKI